MGLSFLAPLFFAGMALIGAPYLIHRIRRPEREPLKFSSVMFIPDITKEVIERRQIEHILLMLLRMAVLALLALAFARPYWRAMAAVDSTDAPKRHMVLLDASYSMDRADAFEEAKRAARRVLDSAGLGEAVGVIVFADRPRVVAPLDSQSDDRAGSKDAARDAVNLATLTYGATDYIAALEMAQQQLLLGEENAAPRRSIVHLVTDAQRVGLPEDHAGWKLAPAIELNVVSVGKDLPRDFAISETFVRPTADGTVRVLGKVRNWSAVDAKDLIVTLAVAGQNPVTKQIDVNARSASQISFELPDDHPAVFDGYLEVTAGGAAADDRRYFSYSPPRQGRIAIVSSSADPDSRSGAWFFVQALPESVESPWRGRAVAVDGLIALLNDAVDRPDVVLVTEDTPMAVSVATALEEYLEDGGQVVFAVRDAADLGPLSETLGSAGISLGVPAHDQVRQSQFEALSWVDFDHPVFALFQGTRYNDFSQVRLYNHLVVETTDAARVIARLDNDAPAIIETAIGDGRAIVWAFPARLEWTNLPKTQRFVPLLFETLAYASGWEEMAGDYEVGQALVAGAFEYNAAGEAEISVPGEAKERTITVETAGSVRPDRPGVLRSRPEGAEDWRLTRAVNVDAREGDPERMEAETLLARVATSAVLAENTAGAGIVGTDIDAKGYRIDEEYGRWALIAVCMLVLIECIYMSRLSARRAPPAEPVKA